MRRLIIASFFALTLTGCAMHPVTRAPAPAISSQPLLRLSPASLGHALALQQQLSFSFGDQQRSMDALLEVDAQEVRLAVQAMGQSALRLRWDGKALEQSRANWLPPTLQGERVLSDLQLAYWPMAEIQAALPSGWTLSEIQGRRELHHDAQLIATISYPEANRIEIDEAVDGYRLSILSVPMDGASP
ncbi:MAG TPA: DUF3261 domain-containing protein [Arenimonas sp.]|uniref:DUF3261 domain-containing protein n=1 Tax=Arenimonas sp. TaxID=1872635 RepID=UPI002D18A778|nr:DUF3261 domain-containing protein [Arenimonas sp.]HMB57061.1 DUF3261 domain-containing protein [Arenimonas sp.]